LGDPRKFAYSPAPTVAAALSFLRQETFPRFVDPPQFFPRTRGLPAQPAWLTRLLGYLTPKLMVIAAIAAMLAIVGATAPSWAALGGSTASTASLTVHSSSGVTGTTATRSQDLSAATFVGGVPFVQQANYLAGQAGAASAASRFVEAARQAPLASYIQGVSEELALPYLNDVIATKNTIDAWTTAVAEVEERAALRSAVAGISTGPAWQGSLASGTRIPGARITFYACIGSGFCGSMANGQQVFAGAAACSSNMPFGTKFVIAADPSRVFVCLDRGALSPTWVDVWFYDPAEGYAWQSIVGGRGDIVIVD
jgi:hypothetical protein